MQIIDYYIKTKNENLLQFEYDKKNPDRPSWIKILNRPKGLRFISTKTQKSPEIVYRSLGDYFYPIDATPDEKKLFMDAIARDWDRLTNKNNKPWAELILKYLKKLRLPKNIEIIDIGSGTGVMSSVLANAGYSNLTLMDQSAQMLKAAKQKPELKNAKFIFGNVSKDLPDKTYDLIVSIMIFDYFDDLELKETLQKWTRCLSTKGIFAVVENNKRDLYHNFFETLYEGFTEEADKGKFYFIGRKGN